MDNLAPTLMVEGEPPRDVRMSYIMSHAHIERILYNRALCSDLMAQSTYRSSVLKSKCNAFIAGEKREIWKQMSRLGFFYTTEDHY